MGRLLLLAFVLVPIAEIAIFVQAGDLIGLWPTIGLVILTAVIGTAMLRAQGLATLMRLRATMDRGELPLREVFDGACLLLAGALLLTPGFLTDTIGFLLLVPGLRTAAGAAIFLHLKRSGNFSMHVHGAGASHPGQGPGPGNPGPATDGRGPVIDTEYTVVDEDHTGPGEERDRLTKENRD